MENLTDAELIMAAMYKILDTICADGRIKDELQTRAVRGICRGTKALPKTKTEG